MKKQATSIGFIAIFLWSSLALFTSQVSSVPPMLSLAITLGMSSIMLLIVYFIKGELSLSWKKTPLKVMMLGGFSYFLYHLLYFYAFQNMPNLLVGILSYMWPLMVILLTIAYRKGVSNGYHLVGGVLGFIGTILLIQSNSQLSTILDTTRPYNAEPTTVILTYLAACGASIVWGGYSFINSRYTKVPSSSVLWNCIIGSILSFGFHMVFEPSQWHFSQSTWIALLGLGFGPIGIAFLCWDIGIKRGNLSLLAVLSYTAPSFSIIWPIVCGQKEHSLIQILAVLFVSLGTLIALYKPIKATFSKTA